MTHGPWIDHDGIRCPLPDDTAVEVRLRYGGLNRREAGLFIWKWNPLRGAFGYERDDDIVAYRVIKGE
jgi:hypothetical protein